MSLLGFFALVIIFIIGNWWSKRGNKYTRATENNWRLHNAGLISKEEAFRRNREITKKYYDGRL